MQIFENIAEKTGNDFQSFQDVKNSHLPTYTGEIKFPMIFKGFLTNLISGFVEQMLIVSGIISIIL